MTTAHVGRDDHMTSKLESSNAPVDEFTDIVSLPNTNHLPGIAHRSAQAARVTPILVPLRLAIEADHELEFKIRSTLSSPDAVRCDTSAGIAKLHSNP
jgi:hypothetical protein